jgi:hypothetical protein
MTTLEHPTVMPPPVPPAPPRAALEPPASLPRILLGLVLVVAAFDSCFWQVNGMGFSVAVFVPVLAAAILANRTRPRWRRSTVAILALLAGACWAAAIETGVTNTVVLLVLVLALAGDSFFDPADPAWSRWFSQVLALAFAPGRVFWLGARMAEAAFGAGSGTASRLVMGALLAIPALVLAVVFGSLLASGNAVFESWTGSFFNEIWDEVERLLDLERMMLWMGVAFLALPLLRPARISAWWWSWIPRIPRLPGLISAHGAIFSSALVLVALNALFAVANAADAMYLWSGDKLPAGVTYSGYVHSGVASLTFTVLLSAVVLAGLFQQQPAVAGRRGLKVLGLVWIAQNLFVLVSVVLRLKLYIEAYDMSVARLSVILFLLLVAAGYGLLAIKIGREKSLPWLVGGCALAIFATLYVAQFLNLAGWSADYNVARWEQDKTRRLDSYYLRNLGPAAWPALRRASDEGAPWNFPGTIRGDLQVHENGMPRTKFDTQHWREFSLRAWWNRGALEEK